MHAFIIATSLYLAATPKAPGQLTIEVKPANCVVMVDGKKKGTGAKPIVVKLPAGRHVVRVTHKGDAHEEDVVVKPGEKKTWKWTFEDDGATAPKKDAEKAGGEKPSEAAPVEGDKPDPDLPK